MERVWKKIDGFTSYECSNYGEIKTFNWKNKGIERIMSPATDAGGYLRTMLKRDSDGKFCTIKVHRIVALTFLEIIKDKNEVNHINGIKSDNRLINLEWCNRRENLLHSYKLGLSDAKGEKNPATKLKDYQVIQIRKKYTYNRRGGKPKYGDVTKPMLAKEYGVNISVIKDIVTNKTWKHLL